MVDFNLNCFAGGNVPAGFKVNDDFPARTRKQIANQLKENSINLFDCLPLRVFQEFYKLHKVVRVITSQVIFQT